jgi:hypothetical protein
LAVIQTIRIALWTMVKLHDPMMVATASAILCPGVRRVTAGAHLWPEAEANGALA